MQPSNDDHPEKSRSQPLLLKIGLAIIVVAIGISFLAYFHFPPFNSPSKIQVLTQKYKDILRPVNTQHSISTESGGTTSHILLSGIVTSVNYPNPQAARFTVKEDNTGKVYNISTTTTTRIQLQTLDNSKNNQPKIINASSIKKDARVKITSANYAGTDTMVADIILLSFVK